MLYATTPTLKVIALDAATGREIWKFDPGGGAGTGGRFRHRGVTVYRDRVFVTYRSYLWALDRKTGRPIRSFGSDGRIDLREGLDQPAERLTVSASTPGAIFEDLLIMGSSRAGDAAGIAGPHPRVRREQREGAMDLPHGAEAGRVRIRHVAARRIPDRRRRQRVGGRDGRPEKRDGLRRHRIGVVRFLRRFAARRQPVRRLRSRARRAHRQTYLALPGHSPRRLGLGLPCGAESRDRDSQRP